MEPLTCSQGSYNDSTLQDSCITCGSVNTGEGKYCPYTKLTATVVASTAYTTAASQETACLAGHKCETEGLEYPTPCSAGFYQNDPGMTSCLECPARHYCPYEGMVDGYEFECPD
jgi:hypothetical protein